MLDFIMAPQHHLQVDLDLLLSANRSQLLTLQPQSLVHNAVILEILRIQGPNTVDYMCDVVICQDLSAFCYCFTRHIQAISNLHIRDSGVVLEAIRSVAKPAGLSCS